MMMIMHCGVRTFAERLADASTLSSRVHNVKNVNSQATYEGKCNHAAPLSHCPPALCTLWAPVFLFSSPVSPAPWSHPSPLLNRGEIAPSEQAAGSSTVLRDVYFFFSFSCFWCIIYYIILVYGFTPCSCRFPFSQRDF